MYFPMMFSPNLRRPMAISVCFVFGVLEESVKCLQGWRKTETTVTFGLDVQSLFV
ncbi:hypothetical protein Leryth_019789 [Lithospermum erythrorhizon]|nr:hypothetical protein Leryth_019789 [Lithospermum erythrorhizon]